MSLTSYVSLPPFLITFFAASIKLATKTCNLFCNIASKRVEKRCCGHYHLLFRPVNNLIWNKMGLIWVLKRATTRLVLQQCCKTSCMFFWCPFFSTFSSVRLIRKVLNVYCLAFNFKSYVINQFKFRASETKCR